MKTKPFRGNRAVAVVRVSERAGRYGPSFVSPDVQEKRLDEECEHQHYVMVERPFHEIDVSGGKPLSKRPGLKRAIEMVQDNQADIILVAYFDRLVRSIRVQTQAIDLVEDAGGDIVTLDHGCITNGTAGKRLESNIMGSINQYYREHTAEVVAAAKEERFDDGVFMGQTPLGYQRNGTYDGKALISVIDEKRDGKAVVPDPATVPIVQEVFRMRDNGAQLRTIRLWLATQGIKRTDRGVSVMLHNRTYIGEARYGHMEPTKDGGKVFVGLRNTKAHEAIIDRDLFDRVSSINGKGYGGRRAKSERWLSRQRNMFCGTCGGKMYVGSSTNKYGTKYPFYACVNSDCPKQMTIKADYIEVLAWEAVCQEIEEGEGRASPEEHRSAARARLKAAQDHEKVLKRRLYALGDDEDDEEAIEAVKVAKEERISAQADVDRYGPDEGDETFNIREEKNVERKRRHARSLGLRITINPGRAGPHINRDRIDIDFTRRKPTS